ncbi:hypothetical protein AcV5_006317 [Taiwanofungus camphoratus]|nr:hypothetical protein AcV5_006317 [Antrodia cinnamomea]
MGGICSESDGDGRDAGEAGCRLEGCRGDSSSVRFSHVQAGEVHKGCGGSRGRPGEGERRQREGDVQATARQKWWRGVTGERAGNGYPVRR